MSPFWRFFYILALTAMWSPSYLFIKLAVQDLPPLTIVSLRVSMGAAILYVIMRLSNRIFPTDRRFWIHSTGMAILSSGLPFCLFCFAEQTIDSSLAAILNGSSPMFTAVLAHLFLPSDRISPQKIAGIALSSLGLYLFFSPNIEMGFQGTALGMLAALAGTISYSMSHVYAKKFSSGQPPFVAPTAQLLMSGVLMTPLALYFDNPLSLAVPSFSAILGVCGLTLFGTIIAFVIYYKLIEHCGATAISMVACFFPVGGMLLGFLFLGESFSSSSLFAAGFIFAGMLLVNEIIVINSLQITSPSLIVEGEKNKG